jgi:aldehyde:ferredoxin oxidoreductase
LPGVEWTYGSILSDRDIDEHDFQIGGLRGQRRSGGPTGIKLYTEDLNAEQHVALIASKTIPYTGDLFMFNYAWQGPDGSNMAQALENGIYSRHKAKLVAWHRHYTRFWKQSVQYCDWMYSNFISEIKPHHSGFTPEAEPKFYNAVTGEKLSFAAGMEIGRRIWNLDRAIWILQGRHRDMEKPAAFLFKPGAATPQALPVFINGQWHLDIPLTDMFLDETGVETLKTHYYDLEGWDTSSGWPSQSTLENLGLSKVANELRKAGRLGTSGTYKGK